MAALTQDRPSLRHGDAAVPVTYSLPVKASEEIFSGSIVCIDSTGYAVSGSTALGLYCAGAAQEYVDNTSGSSGDVSVLVRAGAFWLGNSSAGEAIAITEVGEIAWIADDQTVSKTDATGTRSPAGKVIAVSTTDGVLVQMGLGMSLELAKLPYARLASFTSTEQTGTGAPQNVAHGLGAVPSSVIVSVTNGDGAAFDVAEGVHTTTNVVLTVTAGRTFKVLAFA